MSDVDVANGIKHVIDQDSAIKTWSEDIGGVTVLVGNDALVQSDDWPLVRVVADDEDVIEEQINQVFTIQQEFNLVLQIDPTEDDENWETLVVFKDHVKRIIKANIQLNGSCYHAQVGRAEQTDKGEHTLFVMTLREET